ncbi:flagellar hook protein FlgE [Fuchsiella alkaliacetigena]|uniref:flagellar hook protein FlgE n=1 Tax=Fuchsiella alkaliacetigena TaxID=957042 RepID=UPI00200B2FA9|nr:flagellar hook protein FlgE [Fuchsiella alkaliacetigena]MCK8823546.1 flagellar hook protein FlgE [Fuchsiella alkaliacetigena]
MREPLHRQPMAAVLVSNKISQEVDETMMRSMFAGVSGLKAHQDKMDVVGNNISNVNTVGYKGSRANFSELLSQTLQGASAPQDGRGGTNPQQIGLGTQLASIDTNMTQGSTQSTGQMTDVAVEGEGFLIVNDGQQNFYTRAGALDFDEEGYLVNSSNGYRVQGWLADDDGEIQNTSADNLEEITLEESMDAEATRNVSYDGNLDSSEENDLDLSANQIEGDNNTYDIEVERGDDFNEWDLTFTNVDDPSEDETVTVTVDIDENGVEEFDVPDGEIIDGIEFDDEDGDYWLDGYENVDISYESNARRSIDSNVFDSQGNEHSLGYDLVKTDYNEWTVANLSLDGDTLEDEEWDSEFALNFNSDGKLEGNQVMDIEIDMSGTVSDLEIGMDFSRLTQFASDMSADTRNVDGYTDGSLEDFTIDGSGTITGSYDNGYNRRLASIGTATFSNPGGLSREGDTLFSVSNNSGDPRIGMPGTGGRGMISPGALEMSNADLSEEFTEMITTQRGFQSNSQTITTTDEMLQTLVNLKR